MGQVRSFQLRILTTRSCRLQSSCNKSTSQCCEHQLSARKAFKVLELTPSQTWIPPTKGRFDGRTSDDDQRLGMHAEQENQQTTKTHGKK
ncbi:hypothetical protein EUGRSUZ_H01439 [Eucalyptus grandis]|uniref:Uncharacterized protein n=2 Tax=Eucalyptus grandis TaxID=71139 RepID=A0ACC3JNL8_EUCGR|nr:hypothetical protein EUGRSUZ_H01439 [Eucalyptus grandis]